MRMQSLMPLASSGDACHPKSADAGVLLVSVSQRALPPFHGNICFDAMSSLIRVPPRRMRQSSVQPLHTASMSPFTDLGSLPEVAKAMSEEGELILGSV